MRLRRALLLIPCLLAAIPAHAQLKFKLSGRANTKTVLVEASGMVTATNTTNVTQSTGWIGYGDFWKSSASHIFPVSGGITVKNDNRNESRNLTSLTFSNAGTNGDVLTMGLNTGVTGGANHSFTLSGSATFQLQQSQTFGTTIGGGTFTTGTQIPPLGSGPILEITEAPPAEIQVQIIPEGGGNSITTGIGQGVARLTVRITNVGGGFAENVPYSLSFPGDIDYGGTSPTTSFTGSIALLKAGDSHDFAYSLRLAPANGSSPPYQAQASSSFADSNELNNSASTVINVIEAATDGHGTYWNTSITRPPEIPTLIPPLVQHTFNVGLTSTGGDATTVFQFTPPEGVFIDHIQAQGTPPPGLRLIQGNAGRFWSAFIPQAPAGTVLNLNLLFHGRSGASGDLTVTRAPDTPNASTTTHEFDFGPGGEAYELGGLVFEDVDQDGVRDLDEPACLGCRVHITTADQTLTLTSDLAGFVRAYLPPGPATVTIPGTLVSIPFTVPASDFDEELPVSGLQPELAVEISLGGVDGVPLIVHAGEEIPAATVTITNESGVTAFNVPVTVYFDDYLDFAELENPVTGARTFVSTSFTVASIAPNSPLVVDVPLHRRPANQISDIFGDKITLRAGIDWSDANRHNNVDDTFLTLLDSPPFDCEWTPPGGPVAAGSPVQLTGQLTSNGGSGTATVRVESTVGKILSILVPGATAAPVNLQNGTLWEFSMAVGVAGSQYPISVFGVVPSNGAASYTIRVLSTGPGIDESSATVAVTGDATPTVLVSGQVFYDANSNGMVDGGERVLPNWPVRVVDGAGHTFHLQADGAGNWGVFVAAGSGPGQATPGAGGGGAPGAGFGFMPGAGDLDIVVRPLELSGRAYVDRDGDAIYTPGTDVPFPGLTAYLGLSSATGQTTTTDADGRYLFTLPPDTPGFLLNPAQTGGVARAHIVGLDEPEGFVSPRPVFGVHYVPDFTVGILPLVSTPLNALDFVMGVEPNLVTFDPPSGVNPKIRWPKRLGPDFIPEFNTTLAPNGWMEITSGRTEDAEYYYADLPAAPDGQLFIRLRRPVGGL